MVLILYFKWGDNDPHKERRDKHPHSQGGVSQSGSRPEYYFETSLNIAHRAHTQIRLLTLGFLILKNHLKILPVTYSKWQSL